MWHYLQIMNPFVLIGMVLVLLCATKYANAVPTATHATNSAIAADNATNLIEKLDKTLYNVVDTYETSTQQPQITTQKPRNESQKQKTKRKRGNRRASRTQPDCRTSTERPTTTKPTKVYILLPNIFFSQSWGPGR